MGSYRDELKERWGLDVPDDWVVWETDDSFAYKSPSGIIVGWNKNVETFWRGQDNES